MQSKQALVRDKSRLLHVVYYDGDLEKRTKYACLRYYGYIFSISSLTKMRSGMLKNQEI